MDDFFKTMQKLSRLKEAQATFDEFFTSDVTSTFSEKGTLFEHLQFASNLIDFSDYLKTILDKYPHKKAEKYQGMTDDEFRKRAEEMFKRIK